MTDGFRELEFDLPRALLSELVGLFGGMERAPLDLTHVKPIPEHQGVYQLFLDNSLVYVGKTDAEAGLNRRLARHARKIEQRSGLDPARVSFKAVRVFVFTAVDLEQLLIRHYAKSLAGLAWNNSGFGANDPGRERDTTNLKKDHFDLLFPINIDVPLKLDVPSVKVSVSEALKALRNVTSFVIRSQGAGGKSRKPHPDLEKVKITCPAGTTTCRALLNLIQGSLGDKWQVTVLPGYVIIYKEQKSYPHSMCF